MENSNLRDYCTFEAMIADCKFLSERAVTWSATASEAMIADRNLIVELATRVMGGLASEQNRFDPGALVLFRDGVYVNTASSRTFWCPITNPSHTEQLIERTRELLPGPVQVEVQWQSSGVKTVIDWNRSQNTSAVHADTMGRAVCLAVARAFRRHDGPRCLPRRCEGVWDWRCII